MSEPSPIIIIGAARSGTKFLRDLLASAEGVQAVPYDINYVWRYGAEESPHDVLDPEILSTKRLNYIRNTIRQLSRAKPNDVMIEKTVSNSLRVPFVDKVFPDARYVHLIRDGHDVTESAMRQWQAKPEIGGLFKKLKSIPFGSWTYVVWFAKNFLVGLAKGRGGGGIWGPRFPGVQAAAEKLSLAELCATQWRVSVETATVDLANISDASSRVFTITYANLVKNEDALSCLLYTSPSPRDS